MKVIYSVGASVPGGGIGNVAAQALEALVKNNFLQKAFLTENRTVFLPKERVISFPLLNKIPSYLVKDNLFDFLVARKMETTDIFHGWNNFSLMSLRKAKAKGAKVIIERASSHILTQKKLLEKEMKTFGLKSEPVNPLTLRKSIREYFEADVVLVPSEFAYQSFLENNFPEKKLKLVPFGVDINKFKPLKRGDDGTFRAIFVGQVGIRKGIPHLLQAWEELALERSELLLIGPVFPDLKNLIKNYDLKKVRMINYSNNLIDYYQQSDVFVFPSIEEGSALVIFEAMAAGLPVICTPNSGSVVVDGQEGFLVEPGSVQSLKEALLKLYNNRDLIDKFKKNSRRKVEDYTWENYQEKLLKVYRDTNDG